jgi:hypothetical protein
MRQAAARLREEADGLRDETTEIEAEHAEFLAEIQEPVNALRVIAGLPKRDVKAELDEQTPAVGS